MHYLNELRVAFRLGIAAAMHQKPSVLASQHAVIFRVVYLPKAFVSKLKWATLDNVLICFVTFGIAGK